MVIVGCAMDALFIREQKKTEPQKLRDSWEKFIKRQEQQNKKPHS